MSRRGLGAGIWELRRIKENKPAISEETVLDSVLTVGSGRARSLASAGEPAGSDKSLAAARVGFSLKLQRLRKTNW
jgi:hypothetical protein